MVLPVLVLPSVPGSPDVTPRVEAALRAFRAFVRAGAKPCNSRAFLGASDDLSWAIDRLAAQQGIEVLHGLEAKVACWFYVWSAGLASTNITPEDIRQQLESPDPSGLPGQLELGYTLISNTDPSISHKDVFEGSLRQGVEAILGMMWHFFSDTTMNGICLPPGAQVHNAASFSFVADCMFGALHHRAPLSGDVEESVGRQLWRYEVYRLVLERLGYRPAS